MPNSSSRHATLSEEQVSKSSKGRVGLDPSLDQSSTTENIAPAIQLERISKAYGSIAAVRDLSLEVQPGEIFGFLGLNGAGKTTSIRIILDLIRPSSGSARVFGIDCREESLAARARIGYLPGELGFYGDLTGEATLDVLARLNDAAVDRGRRAELLERMQLSPADLRRKVRDYSTGMKRKLGIVQAFQPDPPLLILDEPTEGLDPLMQDALYELLADTRRRGRTVFMSSHVLSEVERVCDRIGLLRRGELALVSSVSDVRTMAARQVRVLFREDVDMELVTTRDRFPENCEAIAMTGKTWTLRVRGAMGPLLTWLAGFPVEDIEVREPHLEEVLKTYYKDEAPR